ncbi:MAG TPA: pyridoxamine 5'-phosphate oxidase [Thermoanaerobaculia bacterium]|nr:pyridoxamine 5'-phosphate oxidase [Thermoanaerobaculia bacterium]
MGDVHGIRRDYVYGGLDEADAADDPHEQFRRWFEAAVEAGVPDVNAMALATADAEGAPSCRVVLLKGFDERGWVFFTHYDSRKGRELEARPRAALVFYWSPMDRQVLLAGRVRKVSAEESDAYFATRPPGSRLAAAASPQSQPIPDRASLEARVAELEREHPEGDVPRPADWGGYRLLADEVEFWQGRPNRLHDRLHYLRTPEGVWTRERLAP